MVYPPKLSFENEKQNRARSAGRVYQYKQNCAARQALFLIFLFSTH